MTPRGEVVALEATVEAGEVLFVPSGWWHCCLNLEPSIAITQNYAPRSSAFAPAIGGKTVQGGAVESFPIDPSVDSVQIFLQTEGRNLEAKVEVLQGPNNVRQEIEINEDYGYDRPFSCVLDTPGYGSVVRITTYVSPVCRGGGRCASSNGAAFATVSCA